MNRDTCEHLVPTDLHCDHCADKQAAVRYIANDVAKCLGNPLFEQCNDCLRKTLPVRPGSYWQTWMGPWIKEEPCPSRWTEDEN